MRQKHHKLKKSGRMHSDFAGKGDLQTKPETFPVRYSTLSPEALLKNILSKYPLNAELQCEYLYRGLNDNYLVRDSHSKYVLRVYRHNWRDLRDIESEVELIQHLRSQGVSVSFPLPDRESNLIQKVHAPEGLRYAVLFSYAEGDSPLTRMSTHQSYLTGKELAKMHRLTAKRRLGNNRCHLDVTALLYESFNAIKPFIEDRKDDLADLNEVITKLAQKFERISLGDLSFGICHGDFYPSNYHISANNEITLFDFDACCCSWFVMDIAAFCYVITRFYKNAKKINEAFLRGYQEIRPLNKVEIDLIPCFGAIHRIWVLATQCSNFEVFCHFVRTNIKRDIIGDLKKYVDRYCA
jgi:Ser/Thr protein kinase RdoA (MazF antagonist)